MHRSTSEQGPPERTRWGRGAANLHARGALILALRGDEELDPTAYSQGCGVKGLAARSSPPAPPVHRACVHTDRRVQRCCSLLVLGRRLVREAASVAVRGGLQHGAVTSAPLPSAEEATGKGSEMVQARSAVYSSSSSSIAVARAGPPPRRAAGARQSGTRPGPHTSLARRKSAVVRASARAELGLSRSERQAGGRRRI